MNTSPTEFSETYSQARQKFLVAAREAGGVISNDQHDHAKGPSGEDLFLDIARIGSPDAKHVLVVGCGTHGIEGYSGSAVQTHWLSQWDGQLPSDVGVLFFHAHNPWGFAHALRCTEENVDLNRNFVDFSKSPPRNEDYARVHEIIATDAWSEERVDRLFKDLAKHREELGEQAFSDAFNGGQYTHADGIFYGGERVQWSNCAFRRAVRAHLPIARSATLIDLHTGIGPPEGHIFLCFHPEGSASYERVRRWWGERAVSREGVTHKAVAKYHGLLVDAFVEMQPGVYATAVVVEFGTLPRDRMQRASIAARWLWTHQEASGDLRLKLMAGIRSAFYPDDPSWRRRVLLQGKEIIDQALAGLAAEFGTQLLTGVVHETLGQPREAHIARYATRRRGADRLL